ncbi:peptidyl-prolyl cis-trans isomerase [Neobacillus muris]|uniref:peptidyl-prolyl cis-trans isomerase n=1 Tax=Neobacillus muris TaxID=2941334 RepID=UPI00203DB14B|nr:peptidyl-prolyl cis-trans isomerase [Neobacillus muris]
MENILPISGNVKFNITLDPGTWIFDDRKIDLTTYFAKKNEEVDSNEEYTKSVSKHWDREIMEGAIFPPTLKTEKQFQKVKVMTGTFGIKFQPFLQNSEPGNDAKSLIIHAAEKDFEVPLMDAYDLILKFSDCGKPLNEDGPVHIYYGDGSNQDSPIKNVKGFTVK